MAEKKVLVIAGATGAQGGGLARTVLRDSGSPFHVRAITRNVGGEKAKELARQGAEIVAANFDDLESLKRAFRGAHAAYCMTNYWEHFSPERELTQASNLATAAKAANLEHVIWSTLEDTRKWVPLSDGRMPTLQAKYKVPHFDVKGEANGFFSSLGVPATFLLTSFYWENLIYFGMGPKPGPDRVLAITMPMGHKKLPSIAVEDIGKCAYGIFQRGGDYIGKTVGIAGGHPTGKEMAAALSKALGKEVRYQDVPAAVYRGFGFPGADDLGNMFQFKHDFNEYYCGVRDLVESRALNPALQSLDTWLARNKERIPTA